MLLDQPVELVDIEPQPDKIGGEQNSKIVRLHNTGEKPKRGLGGHVEQEKPRYKAHALAVPNPCVQVSVRGQHLADI